MPYSYDSQGRLSFLGPIGVRTTLPVTQSQSSLTTDEIRLPHVYVESEENLENGHLVSWTGDATMFIRGRRKTTFEGSHSHALSSVTLSPAGSNTVAGVVVEKAAEPGSRSYTQKGIHTRHVLPTDSQHIYRVGRDVCLAWVLDDHENELEGVYARYVNGELDDTGPYQLSMVSTDTFAIDRTFAATLDNELNEIKQRLDALTLSS